jgi:hypothetical protein
MTRGSDGGGQRLGARRRAEEQREEGVWAHGPRSAIVGQPREKEDGRA